MNNSAIWLVNTKPQNKQMHGRTSPRRACNPCGYTMKISSRYHRLLIYGVKLTTKIDGMSPFKTPVKIHVNLFKFDSFVQNHKPFEILFLIIFS